MNHRIAQVFEQLLRLLFPARRWRRCAASPIAASVPAAPKAMGQPAAHTVPAFRGEDSRLTPRRLRTHDPRCREEERLCRQRRRNLWFATYGIDLDTRNIHGVGVA
ncbi:hypothetical protein ACODT5_42635 [Streptomyces sp. 5.8]|uniref:hypothetical protein n=1 Tax=Streptomyces sp. 5.8 TaxID=3406571 RepID=UPI003BB4A1A7